jgi:hypothetical protein
MDQINIPDNIREGCNLCSDLTTNTESSVIDRFLNEAHSKGYNDEEIRILSELSRGGSYYGYMLLCEATLGGTRAKDPRQLLTNLNQVATYAVTGCTNCAEAICALRDLITSRNTP